VSEQPRDAEAWRRLAELLASEGDRAGADQAQAQAIRASVHDPHLRQAANALCANDLPVAERILKSYLKQRPTDVAAIRMLAELAGRIGRYRDAANLLQRAVELAPAFSAARFNLATVLFRQGSTAEALVQLDVLLAEEPDNPAYRNLLAAALSRTGDIGEALGHFETALAQQPGMTKVWLNYGHALKTAGKGDESAAAYRRAVALEQGFGEAWWSLANLKTVRFDGTDIAAMEAALALPKLSPDDRLQLHFALGKALEDAGDYEASFEHYAEGNRLRLAANPYDPQRTTARVDRAIALYSPEFLDPRSNWGCPAPDPIFVLGMPRSGSTLVEQILASHPLVEGTQELGDIQMIAARIGDGDESYPEALADFDPARFAELGEEYLQRIRAHRHTDRPFFIDKMPNNWLHAGFIRLILPNAKIIDTRRHPLACCFSNFKQHFARGQVFAYDLDHLGRYYTDYVRLMDHFDAAAPGMIHRVWHEALLAEPEAQIRALLDFAGLPFDSACLRFHENERAVRTASAEQVRRPINRDGVGQWRNYDDHLAPLRAALGDHVARYPHSAG
jgi:tetratricopeptide (TPR) repeat protein